MNWATKSIYVDVDTGELLTRTHIDRKLFIIISKDTTYEKINEWTTERRITFKCRAANQLELFDRTEAGGELPRFNTNKKG